MGRATNFRSRAFAGVLALVIFSPWIGVAAESAPAGERKATFFNYRRLRFSEVSAQGTRPDFPPRPARSGNLREAVGIYLHGETSTARWMDAYGAVFYGGAEVESLLDEKARSGLFREEPRRRMEHLINLRSTAASLTVSPPEKRIWTSCVVSSRREDWMKPGLGTSENPQRPIPEYLRVPKGELALVLRDEDLTTPDGLSSGNALYLVNRKGHQKAFRANSSHLDFDCEALGPDGTWHSVMPQRIIYCGTGLHRVYLDEGRCWKLAVAELDGDYETRIRYRLERDKKTPVVSNDIPARIPRWLLEPE